MRFLQDKIEIFGKGLDPIDEFCEMASRIYQCNLIPRIGQKYLNTTATQVPSKCNRFALFGKCSGQGCMRYYDALMEFVD
jgi:hypothetical protein